MTSSDALSKFLDSFSSEGTRKLYRIGITKFVEWYSKDIDTVLRERREDLTPQPNENLIDAKNRASRYERLLEEFHRWLLKPIHTIRHKPNKAYSLNSARSMCLGIMQLFRYYNMTITLRNGSPVSQTVIATGDFVLQPEHVKRMFHVAKDLRSKLLVSMGKDLGWRIGDILSIRRGELPNLEQDTPIEWLRITNKEKQVAKTCLSHETVMLLREYLKTFPSDNDEYLFDGYGNNGHICIETVNQRLRDLARDAKIELGNTSLHWHCFRKMIISLGKNLGIDSDIIKLMVGKSVKKDMFTYMTGIDVKTAFNKLQTLLGITSLVDTQVEQKTNEKIANLEKAIVKLQQDVNNYKTTNETLANKITQIETILKTFQPIGRTQQRILHKTLTQTIQ